MSRMSKIDLKHFVAGMQMLGRRREPRGGEVGRPFRGSDLRGNERSVTIKAS